MPKKRLTSQKPESLTCERTVAPQAMAMMMSARSMLLRPLAASTVGAMRPPATVRATVALPWATRSAAATTKAATMTGRPSEDRLLSSAVPMPKARSTPPNMPPAPVTRMTTHTGPSASPSRVSTSSRLRLLQPRTTIATSVVMSRAMGVWPSRTSPSAQAWPSAITPVEIRVVMPVLRKIRVKGSRRMSSTVPKDGSGPRTPPSASRSSWTVIAAGTGSSKRRPAHRAHR